MQAKHGPRAQERTFKWTAVADAPFGWAGRLDVYVEGSQVGGSWGKSEEDARSRYNELHRERTGQS